MKFKCGCCGEYKTVDEFYYRDKKHLKISSYCKKCTKINSKFCQRIVRERKKTMSMKKA